LGVSDCDMEKGSMRCEANVSLAAGNRQSASPADRLATGSLPNYKVEIKNINSFRFVERAINFEIERQRKLLVVGKTPIQETRGFDSKIGKTYLQRTKEKAHDYRYFPEPDIPPFTKLKAKSHALRANLPELPDEKIARFIKKYKISQYNAKILCSNLKTSDYYEEIIKALKQLNIKTKKHNLNANKIANLMINKKVDIDKYLPAKLLQVLLKKLTGQKIDEAQMEKTIREVLIKNQKAVADFKKGKQTAITFLLGQVMRETKGRADPQVLNKLIKKELKSN